MTVATTETQAPLKGFVGEVLGALGSAVTEVHHCGDRRVCQHSADLGPGAVHPRPDLGLHPHHLTARTGGHAVNRAT